MYKHVKYKLFKYQSKVIHMYENLLLIPLFSVLAEKILKKEKDIITAKSDDQF